MFEDMKKDLKKKMDLSISVFQKNLAKIRTGRANPNLLDSIKVEIYGSSLPINQATSVVVEDNRTLLLNAWDKSNIPAIEKAILKSDLGLNPSTSGTSIRLVLPPMTEDTRMLYIKQAKQEAEHARISIRNLRTDINKKIKNTAKEASWSDDEQKRYASVVQTITDEHIDRIDKILKEKEKEIIGT